jgi:hypothetical protein
MAEDIKVNDQVIVRQKLRNGNLVKMGSVVRLDGDKALVSFPTLYTQSVVPVSQLEKTSTSFSGYSRVQPSAVRRGLTTLRYWLGR